MSATGGILYLSESDVAGAGIPLDELRDKVAAAFLAKARGTGEAASKTVLNIAPGHVFQAKPAVLRDAGLAAVKWFGLVPAAQTAGPSLSSLIILSDVASGMPVAVMDGNWITAMRTGAMSAIAAQSLARAGSASIGFVACGVQARSHLDALKLVLPGLDSVVAYSRTPASAARFEEFARGRGLTVRTTRDPREAVEGMDVVVTSVPEGAATLEFLDPAWVAPGAFVTAVDLGRSWQRGKLRDFELLATDEHEQTRALTAMGRMTYAGPYDADLADLASAARPGRTSPSQRAMFNFSGHALADIAAAQAAWDTARRKGLGTLLRR